jgi:hypothetical protein
MSKVAIAMAEMSTGRATTAKRLAAGTIATTTSETTTMMTAAVIAAMPSRSIIVQTSETAGYRSRARTRGRNVV